jgi:hypothetical protein
MLTRVLRGFSTVENRGRKCGAGQSQPIPKAIRGFFYGLASPADIIENKNGGKSNGNGNGHKPTSAAAPPRAVKTLSDSVAHFQQDAPTCPNCGHVAVRNGACYKCLNCGESLGCS